MKSIILYSKLSIVVYFINREKNLENLKLNFKGGSIPYSYRPGDGEIPHWLNRQPNNIKAKSRSCISVLLICSTFEVRRISMKILHQTYQGDFNQMGRLDKK
jgi:hypothetical protein